MLRKVPAGFDQFANEKVQDRIAAIFTEWSSQLLVSPQQTTVLGKAMAIEFLGSSLRASQAKTVNDASPFKVWRVTYPQEPALKSEAFLAELQSSLAEFSKLITAEFQVIDIRSESVPAPPAGAAIPYVTVVRFELVGTGAASHREQRIGHWELQWRTHPSGEIRLQQWRVLDEERASAIKDRENFVCNQTLSNLQLRRKAPSPALPLPIMTATVGSIFISASTLIIRAPTNIATRCRTTTQKTVHPIF